MDSQPTPQANEPIPATLIGDASRGPVRVVIEPPRAGWFGRIVRLALFVLVAIWLVSAIGGYYGNDDGLQEQWHSLSRAADDKIAVIAVEGTIFGTDNFVKRQIDRVRDDPHVRAVVLRVDSPGGTVTGSAYLYHHLKELVKQKKVPLVVSMGGIAASGGYYVSMAAGDATDTIFAEPATWTGSIGVIIPHYNISGLLEEIHVQDDSVASNPLKMMGSPTRAFPEAIRQEEQQILRGLVESSFDDFKNIVLDSRPALRDDKQAQETVFTGRIFTATQAQENHLVDKLGYIEDAIDRAIEMASLDKDDVQVVQYSQPQGLLNQMLFGPRSESTAPDLSRLLQWNVPRAYYLCTWLPALTAGGLR